MLPATLRVAPALLAGCVAELYRRELPAMTMTGQMESAMICCEPEKINLETLSLKDNNCEQKWLQYGMKFDMVVDTNC